MGPFYLLLWTMLLWTWMWRYVFAILLSIILDIYPSFYFLPSKSFKIARDAEFDQFFNFYNRLCFLRSHNIMSNLPHLTLFPTEFVSSLLEPGKIFWLPGQIEYARSNTILLLKLDHKISILLLSSLGMFIFGIFQAMLWESSDLPREKVLGEACIDFPPDSPA